ncbi:MAG: aspartate aminotransferase family protein [Myxococcota bacterium]|nr:aspartate aminotransferase family protein [Myxococcota bacterium]
MKTLPAQGQKAADILQQLQDAKAQDLDWQSGRAMGFVYVPDPETQRVAKEAFMAFLTENGLDPTSFQSLLRLENDLVAMGAAHLRGDEHTVGNFTSGGTESCMLAVKSARDYAADRKGITAPEMVLPVTAHAAFHKAAHYFGIKKVLVPVDPETFKADLDAVRAAINENTVLIVGSAPAYAHGVADPIREMGRIALERDVLFHVDGCIGGWLLPYMRRLGVDTPDFDFSVPGVTSISMDLHKYAYTPKGASLVLYKSKEIRRYQIFTCPDWTGYTIINPTIQSSKSGGPLAAAWAVLHHIGDEGYLRMAKGVHEATQRFVQGVRAIPGLRVMGEPEMCLVAVTSDELDIFHVIDEMKVRGWYIQPQLAFGEYKENFHVSMQHSSVGLVDDMLAALRESVEAARKIPATGVGKNIAQMAQGIDPSTLTDEMLENLLKLAGIGGSAQQGLPDRLQQVNEILNNLPVELNGALLTAYFNQMFTPTQD